MSHPIQSTILYLTGSPDEPGPPQGKSCSSLSTRDNQHGELQPPLQAQPCDC